MEINRIYSVYFSATYTTKKIVDEITNTICDNVISYDITSSPIPNIIDMNRGDVLVIGMPVYGGRIPQSAIQSILKLKGNGAPAIISCIYGNRDYDDALLELKNEVEARGFKVVSAGAFIARHSIFTQIAKDRPNSQDLKQASDFANLSQKIILDTEDLSQIGQLQLKGIFPYKVFNQLPIYPTADDTCINCGNCAIKCPANAISKENPQDTDTEKCLACGRCIIECSVGSRNFRGDFYEARATMFQNAFSVPKTNEFYYVNC